MIQNLIQAVVTRLQANLSEVTVFAGPIAMEPTPLAIVVSPAAFQVNQTARDVTAAQPRSQPTQQTIEFDHAQLTMSYPLTHTPLPGSVQGRLVWEAGTVHEQQTMLVEGHDFEIDYQEGMVSFGSELLAPLTAQLAKWEQQIYAQAGREFNLRSSAQLAAVLYDDLSLPAPANRSTAISVLQGLAGQHLIVDLILAYRRLGKVTRSQVQLRYAFAGVFTLREFQQAMLIDVYGTDMTAVEKWASLTNAIILVSYDDILKSCNGYMKTVYQANGFVALHTIDHMQLMEGTPSLADTVAKMQLKFLVTGQLHWARETAVSPDLIKRIISPGTITEQSVDIDVGVE